MLGERSPFAALQEAFSWIAPLPEGRDESTATCAYVPRGVYARIERACKFPEGDPAEVHPADSRAESQPGLNGPSGSPTSPSGRVSGWRAKLAADSEADEAIHADYRALLAENEKLRSQAGADQ